MDQLERDLCDADPLMDQELVGRMPEVVEAALRVAPAISVRRPRRSRRRLVAICVVLVAVLSGGGLAIADSFTSHTGLFAKPDQYSGDSSEIIDVCGRDFPTVVMDYAPTDRPLPAHVTYRMLADTLVARMTAGCRNTGEGVRREPQTVRSLRENFEFTADKTWQVAWAKAVARADTAAAEQAIAEVDATSRRPVVELVTQEHGTQGGYNDRTITAMRDERGPGRRPHAA